MTNKEEWRETRKSAGRRFFFFSLQPSRIDKNDYIMIKYWYRLEGSLPVILKPEILPTLVAVRSMGSCLATLSRWKSPCCPSRSLVEEQSLPPCWILLHTHTYEHTHLHGLLWFRLRTDAFPTKLKRMYSIISDTDLPLIFHPLLWILIAWSAVATSHLPVKFTHTRL